MNSQTKDGSKHTLDKALFESGQQCSKRLYLDVHHPVATDLSDSRKALSESGQQLVELARSAFPKGEVVKGKDHAAVAARTRELLAAESTTVLFGAAFAHDGVAASTDILLRQKEGSIDLFEVKSGTKVKPRYVQDLALQVHTAEAAGFTVRTANLLHVNARYAHPEGEGYAVQQLFKNAEVTAKVRKLLPKVAQQLAAFRAVLADEGVLALPTGTWCSQPFPCPHLDRCRKDEPEFPLRELPDLTRDQEARLHEEGIESQKQVDGKRPGLSFRQRRTVQCAQQGEPIVEPFVREELTALEWPAHFVAIAAAVHVLPRFPGQRPWRILPYAFAVTTLQRDGRTETSTFAHADKDDPRPAFIKALADRIGHTGTLLCWNDAQIEGLRGLLDEQLVEKPLLRTILGRPHFDVQKLLESGWFHPGLHGKHDLRRVEELLLGTRTADALEVRDDDAVLATIDRVTAPRLRAQTREKSAAELAAYARWQTETMLAIHRHFTGTAEAPAAPPPAKPKAAAAPRKQLPTKLE